MSSRHSRAVRAPRLSGRVVQRSPTSVSSLESFRDPKPSGSVVMGGSVESWLANSKHSRAVRRSEAPGKSRQATECYAQSVQNREEIEALWKGPQTSASGRCVGTAGQGCGQSSLAGPAGHGSRRCAGAAELGGSRSSSGRVSSSLQRAMSRLCRAGRSQRLSGRKGTAEPLGG